MEQRPSPEEALERAQAYIAALRAENVPTALVEERVNDIWAWGEGVRLRRAGRGARGEEMPKIQSRFASTGEHPLPLRHRRAGAAGEVVEPDGYLKGGQGSSIQDPAWG